MSEAPDDQQPLSTEVIALLSKLSEKFEPGDNEMKQWMMDKFQNPLVVEILQDATMMMLRVLDAIGRFEPVNGITISKQARIPKGTVSKVTRRLVQQKLITQEYLPNNKKEVLFRVTPLGSEINLAHRAFDEHMERGFVRFLQRYSADELGFLIRLLQDVMDSSFLEMGAQDGMGES